MNLNQIKRERLLLVEAKNSKNSKKTQAKKLRRLANGQQVYVDAAGHKVDEDHEDAESPTTPEFVQHCVSAITQSVENLADTEYYENSLPASYNDSEPSQDAARAQASRYSVKDYKDALTRLRESVEQRAAENVDTRSVVFGANVIDENAFDPHSIQFNPRG